MKVQVVSRIAYSIARALASTLRVTLVGEEKVEAARKQHGGVILVTWHGRTFVGINHYRQRGVWAMISTSRDGEYQNTIFHMYGFNTVRGSTSARGAVKGALKIAKELKNGAILAHTPDGPRGPIHVVHPGAIFLAEKSGAAIIPVGSSVYPARELTTWDKYLVPHPFAKGAMVYGDPIIVPSDLDDSQRAELCSRLGDELNRLEREADMIVSRSQTAGAVRTSPS